MVEMVTELKVLSAVLDKKLSSESHLMYIDISVSSKLETKKRAL